LWAFEVQATKIRELGLAGARLVDSANFGLGREIASPDWSAVKDRTA
jgi:hypothetical protein